MIFLLPEAIVRLLASPAIRLHCIGSPIDWLPYPSKATHEPVSLVLSTRPLHRRLLTLAWPIIIQFYLLQLTGLVDNLMVGQFGEQTIAALGICLQLNFLVVLCYAALTEGGAVIVAQLRGARRLDEIRETLGTLLVAGLAVGSVIGLVYILFGESMLALVTTDLFRPPEERSELPGLGYTYLGIIGLGMPFLVTSHVAMFILQALGNTHTPMRLMLYSNLINGIGNFILLFGGAIPGLTEPLFTPLGLAGVAISTSLSWAFQSVMLVRAALHHPSVAMPLRQVGVMAWGRLGRVMKLGYPLSLDGFLWQGSAFIYTMMFNRVGAAAYAAFLIASTIRGFSLAPGLGLQQATSILLGSSLGANRVRQSRSYVRVGWQLMMLTLPALTLLVALLTPLFTMLYDISAQTRDWVIWMVGLSVLYSAATAVTMVVPGVLRAGGDTRAPMVITFLGFAVVGLPFAWLAGFQWGFGLWGVFAGFVADEVAKALMMVVYLRRETWLRRVV